MQNIPLSIPNISGNEWKYVKDCLDTGWISSVGSYVTDFENKIVEFTSSKYAIAAMNGSAALHLSLQLAGVEQDDYVIAPNITFVATCNTISYHKAQSILIDVDKYTWQMDLDLLEEFLNTETTQGYRNGKPVCIHKKAKKVISVIMPVHVLGNMCDMDRLMGLANAHNIVVVEDSTEALGSTYKGKHAGTFGLLGTSSFNGNKLISTGGGGMIFTSDGVIAKYAKHLTTQAKVDPFEYMHDETGYNYRLVNILAAVGVAQMEQLPSFLERKKVIDQKYRLALESNSLYFQKVTEDVVPNNWLHTMWVDDQRGMIKHLLDNGVQCRPFWVPMNQLPMYKENIYVTKTDVADKVYKHCISIPSSTGLTDEQVDRVIEVVLSYTQIH
jgi:perosamine synthetase